MISFFNLILIFLVKLIIYLNITLFALFIIIIIIFNILLKDILTITLINLMKV